MKMWKDPKNEYNSQNFPSEELVINAALVAVVLKDIQMKLSVENPGEGQCEL